VENDGWLELTLYNLELISTKKLLVCVERFESLTKTELDLSFVPVCANLRLRIFKTVDKAGSKNKDNKI
jgi:hypothetical protein